MSHESPSPRSIQNTFLDAGLSLSAKRAQDLAAEIQLYGGLEPAMKGLAQDEAFDGLKDALAYRDLLGELDRPTLRIARLLREAESLEARAVPAWAEASDLRGRGTYRRVRGETTLACELGVRAQAAERFAARLEAQALRHRLQAAELQAGVALQEALAELAA